jgi:hypothetical protein
MGVYQKKGKTSRKHQNLIFCCGTIRAGNQRLTACKTFPGVPLAFLEAGRIFLMYNQTGTYITWKSPGTVYPALK